MKNNDKPARIYYYNNGKVEYKIWYKNRQFHRDNDKPAYIRYYNNGKINYKIWYKNGQFHRDNDKPAYIKYYNNGKVNYKVWYKYGVKVTEEFCKQDYNKIDTKIILKESNAQKRMMYIQLIGLNNVLKKLPHKSLGISEDNQYELLQFDNIFSIPMKVLKMKCPSIGVYYFIPVNPRCNTWEEALKYYYNDKEYEFEKET